ncbi:hypothetical protein C4F50_01010 [Flavobacterium sp. KB82]|uniref:Uncharacterized protein n=1 Tax=Flavobacterium hungaricum TaxID=2082725 RepID=A0ABR9TDR7_9FLAO|nr:hypothetical protein [Flavobacterium hungaricum]
MKSSLAYVFHFLYWCWFIFFFFFVLDEIFALSEALIGEGKIFMIVITFVLFFVGLFLYLFSLTFESENQMHKHVRAGSLVLCVILIVVFFIVFKNNSELRVRY